MPHQWFVQVTGLTYVWIRRGTLIRLLAAALPSVTVFLPNRIAELIEEVREAKDLGKGAVAIPPSALFLSHRLLAIPRKLKRPCRLAPKVKSESDMPTIPEADMADVIAYVEMTFNAAIDAVRYCDSRQNTETKRALTQVIDRLTALKTNLQAYHLSGQRSPVIKL